MAGRASSNDGNVGGNHGSDDLWLVKLNGFGSIQWQRAMGGTNADEGSSIHQTTDGGYIVGGNAASNDGDVSGNQGYVDIWVIKSGPDGIGIHERSSPDVALRPNPTTGSVWLTWNGAHVPAAVKVLDICGRVLEVVRPNGDGQMLDFGHDKSGVYLVKVLFTDGTQALERVVKD